MGNSPIIQICHAPYNRHNIHHRRSKRLPKHDKTSSLHWQSSDGIGRPHARMYLPTILLRDSQVESEAHAILRLVHGTFRHGLHRQTEQLVGKERDGWSRGADDET